MLDDTTMQIIVLALDRLFHQCKSDVRLFLEHILAAAQAFLESRQIDRKAAMMAIRGAAFRLDRPPEVLHVETEIEPELMVGFGPRECLACTLIKGFAEIDIGKNDLIGAVTTCTILVGGTIDPLVLLEYACEQHNNTVRAAMNRGGSA